MSTKKQQPDHPAATDDTQLFREAMQDVTPMQHDRVVHSPARTSRRPQQTSQNSKQSYRYSTDNVPECDVILSFERPGFQKANFKKLKAGKFPPEASLDLHGYTAEQARSAFIEFMDYCQQANLRTVCIVHGKGFGSNSKKPVIKPLINKWLMETSEVLGFCSAQPKDGGTGAVYVRLKRHE